MPGLVYDTQKWLSVIGALVREKAMLAKAGMKTVSEVQNLVLKS